MVLRNGTYVSHPENGQLYYSPYKWVDAPFALKVGRQGFCKINDESEQEELRKIDAMPRSPGEYVVISGGKIA